MLSSERHSPEKLASRPPAIKISGDIPMDSDAHGIMPRALSPAERPGCCSDFVYSESRSGSRCYSALMQWRATWGGGTRGQGQDSPIQPPHTAHTALQPSPTPAPVPGIKAKGPLHCGCWGGDVRVGDGDSPALSCHLPHQEQPPIPEQGSGSGFHPASACLGGP